MAVITRTVLAERVDPGDGVARFTSAEQIPERCVEIRVRARLPLAARQNRLDDDAYRVGVWVSRDGVSDWRFVGGGTNALGPKPVRKNGGDAYPEPCLRLTAEPDGMTGHPAWLWPGWYVRAGVALKAPLRLGCEVEFVTLE